jgi:hypothetical protein
MLQVVPKWFRLLLWPAHLQIDYSPNEIVASTGMGSHELLGLALWGDRRRDRRGQTARAGVSFGLLWCAVSLFPVSNIVPTSIVSPSGRCSPERRYRNRGVLRRRVARASLHAPSEMTLRASPRRARCSSCLVWDAAPHDTGLAKRRAHLDRERARRATQLTRAAGQGRGGRRPHKEFDRFLPVRRNRGASTTSSACCFARWRRIRRRRRSFGSVSSSRRINRRGEELAETLLEEGTTPTRGRGERPDRGRRFESVVRDDRHAADSARRRRAAGQRQSTPSLISSPPGTSIWRRTI